MNFNKSALVSGLVVSGIAVSSVFSSVNAANLLSNPSFETTFTSNTLTETDGVVTFYYQPSGANIGWIFGGSGLHGGSQNGLVQSYSLLQAYDGQWFAFLRQASGSLSQTFNVSQDTNLTLNFALALRPNYSSGQVVKVSLDGNTLTTLPATSTTWTLETIGLGLVSSGIHTIAFQGISGSSGDTTSFIDAVSIDNTPTTSVPEPLNLLGVTAGMALFVTVLTALKKRKISK